MFFRRGSVAVDESGAVRPLVAGRYVLESGVVSDILTATGSVRIAASMPAAPPQSIGAIQRTA